MNYGDRVEFIAGEHVGIGGTILRTIQKRYSREPTVHEVQVDGFPKPGGWSGKVAVEEKMLRKIGLKP